MLDRFAAELQSVNPERIAFLTFTRAARLEALSRSTLPENQLPWVKTIHAICYKLLRVRQGDMMGIRDLKNFGKEIGVDIRGVIHDPWSLESVTNGQEATVADRLLQLNHLGRHRQLHLKDTLRYAATDLDFHYAKWFTEAYRSWKTSKNLYDYTDLLTVYLKSGKPLDVEVMFIDEGQDLSQLQWAVTHKLGANVKRRYLAGDDDQAIFTWAGASPELFNNEPADDIVVLPQSYRIPKKVHELSESIVKRIKTRQTKVFEPREHDGEVLQVGYLNHEHLGDTSTYVLFRNHFRGLELAKTLEALGWPYMGAYSPIDKSEIRDLLKGYGKVLENQPVLPSEAQALVAHLPSSYVRRGATEIVNNMTVATNSGTFINKALQNVDFETLFGKYRWSNYLGRAIRGSGLRQVLNPTVTLMSIHQSKGREASTVILDLEMSRRTYESFLLEPDNEHRVFYVAVTRAIERLITLLPTEATYYQL